MDVLALSSFSERQRRRMVSDGVPAMERILAGGTALEQRSWVWLVGRQQALVHCGAFRCDVVSLTQDPVGVKR